MDKEQAARAERLLKFFEWVAHEEDGEHRKKKTRKTKARAA
jgi:hypothetical protein